MKQRIVKWFQQPCITFTWMSAFLYGLFFILMLITISNKENYHIDEIATFRLANGPYYQFFSTEKTYVPANRPYLDAVTVSDNDRFNYKEVWKNQASDVHPPLYYALIHTLCSFFSKTFSNAEAASINIIFALLTLYALRKLIRELTNDDKYTRDMVSLVFILSSGILSAVSFFRMYIVAMFWLTLLTALLIKELKEQKTDKFFLAKFYLIVMLGSLTHYYCIVFAALICAVFGLYLLIQKKWCSLSAFTITGLAALGSAYAIFPAMFKHMFFSTRGKQSLTNLAQSPHEYWERLKKFYSIVNTEIFGGIFQYIILGLVCLTIVCFILKKRCSVISFDYIKKYVLIFLPCLVYFLLVSKIAAYITNRYMYPIYAIMVGSVLSLTIFVIQKTIKNKIAHIVIAAILLTVVVKEYKTIHWSYLYKSSASFLSETKKYGDTDCLYVFDAAWKTLPSFKEIENYKSVTFIDEKNLNRLKQLNIADQKKLIVLIINNNKIVLKRIMSKYPQLSKYKKIGSFAYTTSYYLYSDE